MNHQHDWAQTASTKIQCRDCNAIKVTVSETLENYHECEAARILANRLARQARNALLEALHITSRHTTGEGIRKARRDVNAPDDRSQRIAAIEDTLNLTYPDKKYWDNDIAWLLDELEKADKKLLRLTNGWNHLVSTQKKRVDALEAKLAYDEAVLVRSANEIEKLAGERDVLEAKIAQIRKLKVRTHLYFTDATPVAQTLDYIDSKELLRIIDAPASEGKTP